MHAPATGEDASQIRSALITHIAALLATYREGPSGAELSTWVRSLSTWQLVSCLGRSPSDTASRLAEALTLQGATVRPADAIRATIDTEYPTRSADDRARLTEFTKAVRDLAKDNDGVVTAPELFRAGFGSWEAAKLMPAAKHILAVIGGDLVGNPADPLPPIERLRRAGERAELAAAA